LKAISRSLITDACASGRFAGARTMRSAPFTRSSVRGRYLTFFSPMPSLPDTVLGLLTSVDYRRNLSLVAEEGAGTGELVALASFGATDADRREVALVVRDAWQRQRVGTALGETAKAFTDYAADSCSPAPKRW
jgi:hypothetical protein